MKSKIGQRRIFKHPETKVREVTSTILDEIYVPDRGEHDAGSWGKYVYGAWLEEDAAERGIFYISLPYWRNGRFAGQYTLRVEPWILRRMLEEMRQRGWLDRPSWHGIDG